MKGRNNVTIMKEKSISFVLKILKVGLVDVPQSIAPILIYTVLSMLYSNQNISKGFSLTYPYQFLFMSICAVTVRAQLKSEAKSGSIGDRSYSGIIVWLLLAALIDCVSYMNIDSILKIFDESADSAIIFMYGIIMLTLDYTIYYTVNIMQYQEKFKRATILTLSWYATRFATAYAVSLFISDYKQGLHLITTIQIILLVLFLFFTVRPRQFSISLRDGFKYSVNSLPHSILMCLIYLFGYSKAANVDGGYFAAYNLEALCTDTQWDILSSGIDTAVTTEICKNNTKNKKQYIIGGILYSILLYISSAVMLLLYLNMFADVDSTKVWLIFIMECSGFPLYAIMYCIEAEIVIIKPLPVIAVLTVVRYVVRTVITMLASTPYAISFGVLTSLCLGLIQWGIVYKLAFGKK